jgi:hypothetical protein
MPPMNDERPPREAEDPSDETTSRDEARESAEPSESTSSDEPREEGAHDDARSEGAQDESSRRESDTGASDTGASSAASDEESDSSADDASEGAKDAEHDATASTSRAEDPSSRRGQPPTDPAEAAKDEAGSEKRADEGTPPREETAAALEAEAAAAREAVTEASKPEPPRYPPPDARTQKLAGWGCVFLLIALTFGFVVVFRVAFMRLTALDTNMNGYEITTGPADATRRPDREPESGTHSTAPEGGGVAWRTDLEAAFREARRTERPLLLHFEARWAMASRDMLEGTYANVTVREALGSFVPVRIDLTERDASEEELVRRYRVEGLPHVVYIAPEGYRLRPDSKTLVDASDMEVFLQEALGAWQDGRRYDEPVPADETNAPGVTGSTDSNASDESTSPPSTNEP